MPDKPWKDFERETAAKYGVQRLPSNGRGQPDVRVPPGERRAHPGIRITEADGTEAVRIPPKPRAKRPGLGLEMKHRRDVPSWLWDALDQAAKNAGVGQAPGEEPELPAVVFSQSGTGSGRKRRAAVLMDLSLFIRLTGGDPEMTSRKLAALRRAEQAREAPETAPEGQE